VQCFGFVLGFARRNFSVAVKILRTELTLDVAAERLNVVRLQRVSDHLATSTSAELVLELATSVNSLNDPI
jgi:hypothetical protein